MENYSEQRMAGLSVLTLPGERIDPRQIVSRSLKQGKKVSRPIKKSMEVI